MDIKQTVIKLCQGNPGALQVLIKLYEEFGLQFFMPLAISLELTGTKAPNLWVVYKDICDFDLNKTHDYLEDWFKNSAGSLGSWLKNKGVEYAYE